MPIPVNAPTTLDALLDRADEKEHAVIRSVAIRAGLLVPCRCGWSNPGGAERCDNCRTRVLARAERRTVEAVGLTAVRAYLLAESPVDGDARFVAACRTGSCGSPAVVAADRVLAGAEQYGYRTAWMVLAEEIIAEVEIRSRVSGREVSR